MDKSRVACKIGVIADDLTGANDAGVQFRKANLSTTVVLEEDVLPDAVATTDVVVVNTDTRHCEAQRAYDESKRTAQVLGSHGVARIYKKIDSTLRGNVGAEIDGIMDALNLDLCVLAPSFPANARTTLRGRQLVNGTPLEDTESSRDILAPSYSSYIPDVIARQSRRKIGVMSIDAVRQGPEAIRSHAEELRAAGYSILVLDALEQRDLAAIAEAIADLSIPHMASGSAGLAAELPAAYGMVGSMSGSPDTRGERGVLAVVGSATYTSALQVARATKEDGVHSLTVDPEMVRDECTCADHVNMLTDEACEFLARGDDVIVSVRRHDASVEIREQSQRIRGALTRIASSVVMRVPVRGIAVTGGDTAEGVFRALHACGISLENEVLPGVPCGRLVGGIAHKLRIVTKSGSFGDSDALLIALNHLKH